jgi:predicted helicase
MSKLNLGLYDHVEDAIQAVINTQVSKGRIVIPTGGGKTAVEAHSLRLKGLVGEFKIHLVLSPRIALTNQLIKEYRNYIGQNYLSMAFHSGRDEKDSTAVRWETFASTSKAVVQEQIERAKFMGKHLVIFSPYHSAGKLEDIKFGMVIADESQYCTSKEYFEGLLG